MAGVVGFEPTDGDTKKPLPYHLATPQYKLLLENKHIRAKLSTKNFSDYEKSYCSHICYHDDN